MFTCIFDWLRRRESRSALLRTMAALALVAPLIVLSAMLSKKPLPLPPPNRPSVRRLGHSRGMVIVMPPITSLRAKSRLGLRG